MIFQQPARKREVITDWDHLTAILIQRYGSLRNAAPHLGLHYTNLLKNIRQKTIAEQLYNSLNQDYDVRALLTECDCGQRYFHNHANNRTQCSDCCIEERTAKHGETHENTSARRS